MILDKFFFYMSPVKAAFKVKGYTFRVYSSAFFLSSLSFYGENAIRKSAPIGAEKRSEFFSLRVDLIPILKGLDQLQIRKSNKVN